MVIRAVYENGVFRPTQSVELPEHCEVHLVVQEQAPADIADLKVAPLLGLAAIAGQHPDNPKLPTDLAEQHDHYLYGTAKRP